jgi:hypothetical protein
MALTKEVVVDSITITELGTVEVRTATHIMEDGVRLSRSYHRQVIAPGDVTTGQDARVVAIATAVWTPDVVAAYQARLAALIPEVE